MGITDLEFIDMKPMHDSKNERYLYPDGRYCLDGERLIKNILENGIESNSDVIIDINDPYVDDAFKSRKYYGQNYFKLSQKSNSLYGWEIRPFREDELISNVEHYVLNSPRLKGTEQELKRVATELDYIQESPETESLFDNVIDLIDRFKQDNVVWGVGRGSSCACYVLYLLGVHDVDSIEYDIPFSEFSKEDLDEE